MAKGSAMGIWRGRKGSSVFYYIKNSSNAMKQGIRERNYEISNPKSYAQAGQRMKLLAVQRFYNQLKDVLQRGWEGVKYGTPTRQKFLKYALKADLADIASLTKDSTVVPPSALLVSRGSLCECSLLKWMSPDETQGLVGETACIQVPYFAGMQDGSFESGQVVGPQTMLDYVANGGKEGDQLTVLYCLRNGDVFSYGEFSVIMSALNEIPQGEVTVSTDVEDGVTVLNVYTDHANAQVVGAAIVISRQDGEKYLRSTSIFAVNKYMLQDYFSNGARLNARRSYMNSNVLNNDWPADAENETDADGNVQGTVTVIKLTPGHGSTPPQYIANAGDVITLTCTPDQGYAAFWYAERDAVTLLGSGNTLEWTVQPGQQQVYVEFVGTDVP